MRKLPEFLDRLLHVVGHLAEHLGGGSGIVGDDVPRQPQAHRKRDQILLCPVMQVALHPAALGVTACHDPGPGFAQRVGLLAQFVQGGRQSRIELRIVAGQADLPGQFGEHAVVFLGEGVGCGRPLDDDEPEQLAGMTDRGNPQLAALAPVEQHRQPDGRPRITRYAGPRDDRPLPRRDHYRPRPCIRYGGCPLQHVPGPGEHLGAGKAHGLAQRLGKLQQQLIHRDGTG